MSQLGALDWRQARLTWLRIRGVSGPHWKKKSCLGPHIKYIATRNHKKKSHDVLSKFTILCRATHTAVLGCMRPAGCRLDTPAMVASAPPHPSPLGSLSHSKSHSVAGEQPAVSVFLQVTGVCGALPPGGPVQGQPYTPSPLSHPSLLLPLPPPSRVEHQCPKSGSRHHDSLRPPGWTVRSSQTLPTARLHSAGHPE